MIKLPESRRMLDTRYWMLINNGREQKSGMMEEERSTEISLAHLSRGDTLSKKDSGPLLFRVFVIGPF
jgi:hypothetical protein